MSQALYRMAVFFWAPIFWFNKHPPALPSNLREGLARQGVQHQRPHGHGSGHFRQHHKVSPTTTVVAASCAGRVARGTSGIVRRWRRLAAGAGEWQHGPAPRRLPPYAIVPLGMRPRLPRRPYLRQAHLCHSVVAAASCAGRVARGTSGTVRIVAAAKVGSWGGRVAARPCSQTPAALCLGPSWDAPPLARTAKLASGPPVPFSGSSCIVRRPCCAWH